MCVFNMEVILALSSFSSYPSYWTRMQAVGMNILMFVKSFNNVHLLYT
jgi:hypothetical protein